MDEIVNKINKAIETVLFVRDKRCENWKERDDLAYVCNVMDRLVEFITKMGGH
ncbi:hypothetical protein IJE86_07875 [bacterium]|nr:hypothetical protein [bacterium]